MTKTDRLPMGTICEGTTKDVEIIRAYATALSGVRLKRADRTEVKRLLADVARIEKDENRAHADKDTAIGDIRADIALLAEEYMPPYSMVIEKDNWIFVAPDVDALNEEAGALGGEVTKTVMSAPDARKLGHRYWMAVNDHGNLTLRRAAGTKWIVEWEVV